MIRSFRADPANEPRSDLGRYLYGFRISLALARATVDALLDFDVPNANEPDSHTLTLRFEAIVPSPDIAARGLDFLHALVELAAVHDPDLPPFDLNLERVEVGSLVATITALSSPLWEGLVEAIASLAFRVYRERRNQTDIAGLASLAIHLANIEDLKTNGRLAPHIADNIQQKMMKAFDLPLLEPRIEIQADGLPICVFDVSPPAEDAS